MKALVIEDVRSVRNLLSKMLTDSGVNHVAGAATGAEGIDEIDQGGYDLLFLDIHLPDMSGLEVLTALRKSHPKLFVVIATGYEEVDTVQEIIRLGANHYIVKPLQFSDVQDAVSRYQQTKLLENQAR